MKHSMEAARGGREGICQGWQQYICILQARLPWLFMALWHHEAGPIYIYQCMFTIAVRSQAGANFTAYRLKDNNIVKTGLSELNSALINSISRDCQVGAMQHQPKIPFSRIDFFLKHACWSITMHWTCWRLLLISWHNLCPKLRQQSTWLD